MRRLRRYVAPTSGAHPRHHILDDMGGRSYFIALFLRYGEPESGYYRVEFLSGHIRSPHCLPGPDAANFTGIHNSPRGPGQVRSTRKRSRSDPGSIGSGTAAISALSPIAVRPGEGPL